MKNTIFYDTGEVKQWLRDILFTKQQLRLKIQFYQSLIEDTMPGRFCFERGTIPHREASPAMKRVINADIYRNKIAQLQEELLHRAELFDRMMNVLDGGERCIMTVRYLNGINWEHVEAHIPYSRSQAIRVHNKALNKLLYINWEEKGDEKDVDSKTKACLAGTGA